MNVIYLLCFCLLTGCSAKQYIPCEDPEPPASFCVPEKIRVALVLGGGGVRGMAHVGVIEELVNANIPIDLIVGCSAGSIVGALYADNPDIEHIKCAVWGLRTDSICDINIFTCRYGLSQGGAFHRVIDQHLEAECFEELKIPLVVVATDLYSGELVPLGSGDLVTAVQASCALPFVFVPCEHNGRILVDGGVINPVPAKVAKDLGADIVIAVDLCELLPKTFPQNLFQIANRSAEISYMWQNQACTRFADFVIRPKTCGVGTFNDKMKRQIYEAGRCAAQEALPAILERIQCIDPYPCQTVRQVTLGCYEPQINEDERRHEELLQAGENEPTLE